MKVRDTSQGRMYAVSSEIGCTAINGSMAVDVPVGGQSVILALDKKLIIDGDDNAKFVEVRWGTNAAVGSRPAPSWIGDVVDGLVSIIGVDKFDVNYIPGENKLYLVFSLDTTNEQIVEVRGLLERVLPKDLVVEMAWVDGVSVDAIPAGYRRLSYLQSTGTQYIIANFKSSKSAEYECVVSVPVLEKYNYFGFNTMGEYLTTKGSFWRLQHVVSVSPDTPVKVRLKCVVGGETTGSVNGEYLGSQETKANNFSRLIVCGAHETLIIPSKIYSVKIWTDAGLVYNLIPCLDDTGTPCMLDTLSSTEFYNDGTGDFLYPGKETEATTYSLRNRMYAQYTEHGIRRLYNVPVGYNGGKEEYAEENGFKLLIETPQPEEGYWIPEWHDREDCIELEWVETEEPPTEEELQIEEIENA